MRQPADAFGLVVSVAIVAVVLFAAHSLPAGTAELTANAASSFRHVSRVLVVACAVVAALGTLVLVVALVIEGAEPKGIAVAVDRCVIPRSEWATTRAVVGAPIEIVTAVAGG